MNHIAVVKLSSLGDIIHTLPAFSLLRERFPQSKIVWVTEPQGAGLLRNVSGIDTVFPLDLKKRGFKNRLEEIRRLFEYRKERFDIIVDFQGLIKTAVVSRFLKGESIGFNRKNLREPLAVSLYNRSAPVFNEHRHVIFKNIHLLSLIGINRFNVRYPLKKIIPSSDLQGYLEKHDLKKKQFIIINVGGGWQTKLLSVERLVEIVRCLKQDYRLVLLWGNPVEKRLAAYIAEHTGVLVSIFLNFTDLFYLIKESCVVVSGDTLALHVADAVGTPTLGFFGPTSPFRNGSLLSDSMAVYVQLDCGFCYRRKCDRMDCMKEIEPKRIVEGAKKIYHKCNRANY